MSSFSIAIDGPAGAGKSTIARQLAKNLGCIYIDTGAMYRAVGLYFIKKNMDYNDEALVQSHLGKIKIDLRHQDGNQQIFLNDEDVSTAIRTQSVADAASKVATYKEVRSLLVSMQRQLKLKHSVVMDGRDIGTVVMPDATLKIFLTATAEERAKRRYLEYKEKGMDIPIESIYQQIVDRDYQDSHREHSPLTKAEDAIEVDTTNQTIEDIIEQITKLLKNRQELA
jgi:cytidylate kinase